LRIAPRLLLVSLLAGACCRSGLPQSAVAGHEAALPASQPAALANATNPLASLDVDPSDPAAAGALARSSATASRNARDLNAYPTLGFSFGQTVGSLRIYVFAQDRSAQVPSVFYLRPSGSIGIFRFEYMMQAVPVYILHQPKYYNYDSVALTTERRTVLGAAILPVGERMIFNPRFKLQVAIYANGGFAYFTRRILSEGASRFNIALQFGLNFQYPLTANSSVITGYAINHLSNGDIHFKNPGLDTNLVYVQYLFRLHRKK
jgi:hypothetical protein